MTRAAFRSLRDRIAAYRVCLVRCPNGACIRGTPRNIRESSWGIAAGKARVTYEVIGFGNDYVRTCKGKR